MITRERSDFTSLQTTACSLASPQWKEAIATIEIPANLNKDKTLQHPKIHSREEKNCAFFF